MSTTISGSQNRRTFISNNINETCVKTPLTTKNSEPKNNYWKDTFEPGITQGPTKDYSDIRLGVPASTLLTENTKDSSVNCLDKAAELIDAMPEEQRKNAEVVFLDDNRPGQEGKTGHVVIRDGDKIIDPMSNASYKSSKEYFQKNPQYSESGALKAEDVKHILDTQPGSAERKMALKDTKVPKNLRNMMVADSTSTPSPAQPTVQPGPAPESTPNENTQHSAALPGSIAIPEWLRNPISDFRRKLIDTAQGEIGTKEKGGDTNMGPTQKYANELNEYFNSGHSPTEEYCADFVSWAMTKAGIPTDKPGVQQFVDGFKENGKWKGKDNPKPGDIVIMANDDDQPGVPSHVGIVKAVNEDGSIETIEGNTTDPNSNDHGVFSKTRQVDKHIVGFGSPD